jgi:hypothetical protein
MARLAGYCLRTRTILSLGVIWRYERIREIRHRHDDWVNLRVSFRAEVRNSSDKGGMGCGDCFGTTLAEVADPDLGTRFRYHLRTGFGVGRRKRRKLLAAWDVCQPCRRSRTARMVVLCNLFSRDLSRREQRCDRGYAPSFSADNAVDQARCGHQDERRYRHSQPRLHIRSADLGWRLGFNLFLPVGTARTEIDALVTGALGPIGFAAQNSVSDRLTSFGDPAPQLSWKSNQGANNFMIYTRGGVPVGAYNADRIVNLGDGHASLDNGFGYTYFNAATGLEFSAVTGLTYNFKNPHTDYQNGIDWHLDLEASRFLTKQFFVGAVGYYFNQLTGDSGSGATLGAYISRIAAAGPEIGMLFPVGEMQGSLSLRGYWEFAAQNRSSGWNTWFVFSIAPPEKTLPIVK